MRPSSRILCIAVTASALLAADLSAQRFSDPLTAPGWAGDAAVLGVNTLLGGLTGGVMQRARGGSFQDGFTRGALGGAVIYGGKRLAAQDFPASGLLGREVAAVGASIVRNAADGQPSLSRLALPVGPVRFYVSTTDGARVHARLDLATTANIISGLLEPGMNWDAAASFSSGAPVFRAPDKLFRVGGGDGDELGASGRTRAGVIFLSHIEGLDYQQNLRHERIHVLQNDQFFWTLTEPVESALLQRLPGGRTLAEHVDLNLSSIVPGVLSVFFKRYEHRPWELEAEYLVRR